MQLPRYALQNNFGVQKQKQPWKLSKAFVEMFLMLSTTNLMRFISITNLNLLKKEKKKRKSLPS